jgi:hypothetical protein
MQTEITTIYVVCDDFLKALNYRDDSQAGLTRAEVMTTALVSARFFKNCLEHARAFLKEAGYMPNMLSQSRLNRRLHALPEGVWLGLFSALAQVHQGLAQSVDYIVDSLPIAVCDNYRIPHCRLYGRRRNAFRGYIASLCPAGCKKRYFFGLRAHVLTTAQGCPVELVLAPASEADVVVFKRLQLDLPDGATIYADKAYTDYVWEDLLNQDTDLSLVVLRKSNAKRPLAGCVRYICHHVRKRIETSFSQMADCFAKRIYAITEQGVELKAFLAVLAFSFMCLQPF